MDLPQLDVDSGQAPGRLTRRSLFTGAAALGVAGLLGATQLNEAEAAAGSRLSFSFYNQQKSYSCSAAAARMALSSRGIYKSEAVLRTDLKLGTLPNPGLDDIAYLVRTLNKYSDHYRLRQWSSVTYKGFGTKLSADVKYNVDRGYAVIMNTDRMNADYSKPAVRSAGHYLAIVGYNSSQFLIADPWEKVHKKPFWKSKSTVYEWNKLRRYVAAVNIPVKLGTGPRPPFRV